MPNINEMIQSKFLRKEDLDDDQVVTISDTKLEAMQGNANETRWVLYFKELPKGMVLNTTTMRVLGAAFGDHSDDWKGKKVKIYVDPNVSFQGRIVGGLRLMPPRATKTVEAPKPAPTVEDEFDSEVPF